MRSIRATLFAAATLSMLSLSCAPKRADLERLVVYDDVQPVPLPASSAGFEHSTLLVGRSRLHLVWLDGGTLQYASWNGKEWSTPSRITTNVALDAQDDGHPIAINEPADGALTVHWFDDTAAGRCAFVAHSDDGGATWRAKTQLAAEIGTGNGPVVWLDEGSVAWVADYKSLFQRKTQALYVMSPEGVQALDHNVAALNVDPAAGIVGFSMSKRFLLGYREILTHTGPGQYQNDAKVMEVSHYPERMAFGDHDPWILPDDVHDIGPVIAIRDDRGVIAYFSEHREGSPAIVAFVGELKPFKTPGQLTPDVVSFGVDREIVPIHVLDDVRDLHAEIDADGSAVFADLEGGFPTLRRMHGASILTERLVKDPLPPGARVVLAGSIAGADLVAWRSGSTLSLARVTGVGAPAPAPSPSASSH